MPAAPETLVDPTVSGSRFPQLYNPQFWAQHGSMSDTTIARMLGCHRETVSLARRRNSVPSLPRGRRRGDTAQVLTLRRDEPAAVLIAARVAEEQNPEGPPPSRDYLWARMRAAIQADAAGDNQAFDDALIGLAAAAALVYDQRRKARRA